MRKDELHKAFKAGQDSTYLDFDFETWYEKENYIDLYSLVKFYREVFKEVIGITSNTGLNTRRKEPAELKHIIRGSLKNHYKNKITYKMIGTLEYLAGADSPPHHATILNSLTRWNEENLKDSRKAREVIQMLKNYI